MASMWRKWPLQPVRVMWKRRLFPHHKKKKMLEIKWTRKESVRSSRMRKMFRKPSERRRESSSTPL